VAGFVGLAFALYQYSLIAAIKVESRHDGGLVNNSADGEMHTTKLIEISTAIAEGANAFLYEEYRICGIFLVLFGILVLCLISWGTGSWTQGAFTMLAFEMGGVTSIVAGFIGMRVAVFANVRTTIGAQQAGWKECFNVAFRAGGVMGFALTGLGLLMLYLGLVIFNAQYPYDECEEKIGSQCIKYVAQTLMECIAGYGLGGSSIAMFGRVGGGIYTKAADVGADLVGKVVHGIPEDDPRNPATIADNVGDNVGDVAGMGADLFGSFAESSCACLVVSSQSIQLVEAGWNALMFPLLVSAAGIFVCLVCSFIATHIKPVGEEKDVETVLKVQLIATTIAITPVIYGVADAFLPSSFDTGRKQDVSSTDAFVCVAMGASGGLIIGLITDYFTSHSYGPVREVADSCKTGAATNIIYGLALGYKSVIVPVIVLAIAVYVSLDLADMYGVALAAIGMLSTLATGLTVDAYGPVCDNAGGIAEMAELPDYVREKTDALDAAGNTTAAIGKGFAIGSAALVSLALFGAFSTRVQASDVSILDPITFAGLLMGAMLPYWFSAMTMKSVGLAAQQMVVEVSRQFRETPGLLEGTPGVKPDYTRCITISTDASLEEMILPGALVMLSPIVAGTFFGVYAVMGLLAGGMVSGVQMAISSSNTGGAWDNAKKYIEKAPKGGELGGKGSDIHKAAVVGDTVGDPLKDTSGPALNILMKLMAIISLVFADYFVQINHGKGLFKTGKTIDV